MERCQFFPIGSIFTIKNKLYFESVFKEKCVQEYRQVNVKISPLKKQQLKSGGAIRP